jgi:hypothetical protein
MGNYMIRANLKIGQNRNIAINSNLGSVMFARTLLLLNVTAKRGSLASLALFAIIAFAGCGSQNSEPEFCFTVTGEARESDQEAVQQLWGQRDCSPDLELQAAASLLKAARIEHVEKLRESNLFVVYDGQSPRGTDLTPLGKLRGESRVCVSAETAERICPQKRPAQQEVIMPVPVPVPDAGIEGTDSGVADAAPVDRQLLRQIAEVRVELRREIEQSQSLIGRLRQTGDRAMLGQARRLESGINAAQEIYDNDDATLEELREQEQSLGRAKRSANAALTRFRGVW